MVHVEDYRAVDTASMNTIDETSITYPLVSVLLEKRVGSLAGFAYNRSIRMKGALMTKGSAQERYVIALDQGTTSSRAMLIDRHGSIVGRMRRPFSQIYPQPGWVEHDPADILSSQLGALTELLLAYDIDALQIDSIGITNQRETTLVWDRATGLPLYNAIVWQCRRTAPLIERLREDPQITRTITEKTGLIPDPYFSASKIAWILDAVPGARKRAEAGELAFGTVDSWLIWKLTYGAVHATDMTNASRTMLYNIHTCEWDPWLLDLFNIPLSMMPEVKPSASCFGHTANPGVVQGIPICGVAGDQQAALFGQRCWESGDAKNTYGTGCFLLMNTGSEACQSRHGLITTIAASAPETQGVRYALEGSVFMAGALMQWLRDELGILEEVADSNAIAQSVPDTEGVYIVPAFTGMGAPWWDAEARGAIHGLTRGASRAHIVRAALESLAYQTYDLLGAMEEDADMRLRTLNVDGGASENDFLMQFQSDILDIPIHRPCDAEATALGVAYLAGLTTGFWKDLDALRSQPRCEEVFNPSSTAEWRKKLLAGWHTAVMRTLPSQKQA